MGFNGYAPYISVKNTTYTALSGGATYTGDWENVTAYTSVIVACKADQDGTLYLEFADTPKTTADSSLGYNVDANINEVHKLTVTRAFFRVRYVNGASAQSSFGLQSHIGQHATLTAPANLPLGGDADAIAVRSYNQELGIAQGLFSDFIVNNKLGKNSDIDTGTVPEYVTEGGGVYTGFPNSTAETVDVFSSSADDTNTTGAGAWSVIFFGLDENWERQSETVNLNGLSAVTSSKTWRRIHSGFVTASGSSNTAFNVGTITIRHTTTTANVFLTIIPGTNQSNYSVFTIPAGYTGHIVRYSGEIDRAVSASVSGAFFVKSADGSSAPRYRRPFSFSQNARLESRPYAAFTLPEKTDVAPVIQTASTNNTIVYFSFDVVQIKNRVV